MEGFGRLYPAGLPVWEKAIEAAGSVRKGHPVPLGGEGYG